MRSTHFTHQNPRRPGATRRSGKPWPADSGTPPTRVASSNRSMSPTGSRTWYPVTECTSRLGASPTSRGSVAGSNEPSSYEPVKRRRAPGSPASVTAEVVATYVPAANPPSTPARSSVRREASLRRGRAGRASTCQTASGSSARAAATCSHMPRTPPTERTRPVAYPRPASSAVTASAASTSETQRLGRARRSPYRITRLFHGTSRTTAMAATPWAITTHRPPEEPAATAPIPVAKSSRSATSSARLVRRPEIIDRSPQSYNERYSNRYRAGRRPSQGDVSIPLAPASRCGLRRQSGKPSLRAAMINIAGGRVNPGATCNPWDPISRTGATAMIILGIILLLLGIFLKVSILTTIGIIVLVIGVVLFLLGSFGRPVAGRRHYW